MNRLSCDQVRELAAAYVLDNLEQSTAEAVREHLAGHAGGHPEYAELGQIVPAMAYLAEPAAPPAALKERIVAAAARTAQDAPALRRPAIGQDQAARVPRIRDGREGWARILSGRRFARAGWASAAVAVLAVVALVVANLGLQADLSSSRQFADQVRRAESLAALPGSRIAVIAPSAATSGPAAASPSGGPSGLVVIPASGPGILVMQGLGATDAGHVYEAWAIVGKQAPAPVGSFSVGGDGLGWLGGFSVPGGGGIVVALTREPGPGATTPTLPIIALGTVAG
jgi:hypothetical protein